MEKLTSENINAEQLSKIEEYIQDNLEEIVSFEDRYRDYTYEEIFDLVSIKNYDIPRQQYSVRINLTNAYKIPKDLKFFIEEVIGEKFI